MKYLKRAILSLLLLFVLLNVVAAVHAYKFTHFGKGGIRTERINLSTLNKLKLLLTGVDNPRPENTTLPSMPYKTVIIKSNVLIECWAIEALKPSKGTVLLFHGYTSNKSALLQRAYVFLNEGYNCLLVDFMGSGGSEGNQTTIGFKESIEVKDCFNYVQQQHEHNIYLYGTSMGAVAVIKAVRDNPIQPKGIILDCPFGTMYQTVCARFNMLHIPPEPMADVLLFWGGIENGFNGFSHNPINYARNIYCPTLLQYGEKDERVSRKEIDSIYTNLRGPKTLVTYPLAGHDDYLDKYKKEWSENVIFFMKYIR